MSRLEDLQSRECSTIARSAGVVSQTRTEKSLVEVSKKIEDPARIKFKFCRNDVWRYDAKLNPNVRNKWWTLRSVLFRGLSVGIVALGITIAVEKALGVDYHNPRGLEKYKHGHDHH